MCGIVWISVSTVEDLTTKSPICEKRGGEEGREEGEEGEGERGRRKRRGSPLVAIARRLALFPGIGIGANAQPAYYCSKLVQLLTLLLLALSFSLGQSCMLIYAPLPQDGMSRRYLSQWG